MGQRIELPDAVSINIGGKQTGGGFFAWIWNGIKTLANIFLLFALLGVLWLAYDVNFGELKRQGIDPDDVYSDPLSRSLRDRP